MPEQLNPPLRPKTPSVPLPVDKLPKKDIVNELVEIVRMNPENQEHVKSARRLDQESADNGMLDEEGKKEKLKDKEFNKWIRSEGTWRSLYLGSVEGHPLSMFGDTFKQEAPHIQELIKGGFIEPKEKGEEFATFVPEDLDADGKLTTSLTRQTVSDRFKEKPDLDYLVEYVTHNDDNVLDPEEARVLTDLGFTKATTIQYSEAEDVQSTGFTIRRSDLPRMELGSMKAG